jgi:hypothetical protein
VFDVNTLVYCAAAIICGVQLVTFAVFARQFAASAGLLPPNEQLNRLIRLVSLERGILIGVVMMVVGLVASAYALGFWGRYSFGPLDPRVSLRIVLPAATTIVLGIQLASSSFFLSVLELKR